MSTFTRLASRTLAGLALAGALTAGTIGCANTAAPADMAGQPTSNASTNVGISPTTSVTMKIVNSSGVDLTLKSVDTPHGTVQTTPAQTLPDGDTTNAVADSKSLSGTAMNVYYKLPDGQTIQLNAAVPFGGTNSTAASSGNLDYYIDVVPESGYHPTDTYYIHHK